MGRHTQAWTALFCLSFLCYWSSERPQSSRLMPKMCWVLLEKNYPHHLLALSSLNPISFLWHLKGHFFWIIVNKLKILITGNIGCESVCPRLRSIILDQIKQLPGGRRREWLLLWHPWNWDLKQSLYPHYQDEVFSAPISYTPNMHHLLYSVLLLG